MRDIALKRSGHHMKRSGLCHATNAVKMVPSAVEQRSRLPNMSIVCQLGFAILRIGWRIGERERSARRSFHRARREPLLTPPHSLSVGCRSCRPHLSPRPLHREATAHHQQRCASRTQCMPTAGGRAALGVASCIPVYVNSVGKLPEHCHSSAAEGSARSGILFNPAYIRLYVEIIDTDSQTLTASPRLRRVQNWLARAPIGTAAAAHFRRSRCTPGRLRKRGLTNSSGARGTEASAGAILRAKAKQKSKELKAPPTSLPRNCTILTGISAYEPT